MVLIKFLTDDSSDMMVHLSSPLGENDLFLIGLFGFMDSLPVYNWDPATNLNLVSDDM